MRVEIKQLEIVDNRPSWNPVPAQELVGRSVIDYMLATDKKVIAALYKDDKPSVFVSNDKTLVEKYADKGFSMTAQEMRDLLGTAPVPNVVAYAFGGAVCEIKTPEEENNG